MAPRLLFGRGWRIQWSIVPEVSEVAVSPREARGSPGQASAWVPCWSPEASCSCADARREPCLGEAGEEKAPHPSPEPRAAAPRPLASRHARVCSAPGLAAQEEGSLLTLPSQDGTCWGGQQGGRAGLARWAREQIRRACRRALRMKFYRCAAAHVRSCTRGCGSRAEEL